jgi:DNA repair exonuclease SbcCD nuclease subunit
MPLDRIAVINDPHFGIKNNSQIHLDSQNRYFYNEVIPTLKQEEIKHIIFTGDIFDNRNSINIKIQDAVINLFEALAIFQEIYLITGNHDLFLRSNSDIRSNRFLDKFKNVKIISKPEFIQINNVNFTVIPWFPSSDNDLFNVPEFLKFVESDEAKKWISKYPNCIGHLSILGFPLYRGHLCEKGIPDIVMYNNWKTTISGHFHTRSIKENIDARKIIFGGAPYQMTRNDSGDNQGIGIYEFTDNDLVDIKWIPSKSTIKFVQVVYPQLTFVTEDHIKGNIVDILVDYSLKYDEQKLQEYKLKVENFGPADKVEIKIVNKSKINIVDEVNKQTFGSTRQLMTNYVTESSFVDNVDKEKVLHKLEELYLDVGAE